MFKDCRALIVGGDKDIIPCLGKILYQRGWDVVSVQENDVMAEHFFERDSGYSIACSAEKERERLCFDLVFINATTINPLCKNVNEISNDELQRLFVVNAVSPIRTASFLLTKIKKHTGVMAFITSRPGEFYNKSEAIMPLYSASMAARNMLFFSLLKETEETGITLLSVQGDIRTQEKNEIKQSCCSLIEEAERYRGWGGHHYLDVNGRHLNFQPYA